MVSIRLCLGESESTDEPHSFSAHSNSSEPQDPRSFHAIDEPSATQIRERERVGEKKKKKLNRTAHALSKPESSIKMASELGVEVVGAEIGAVKVDATRAARMFLD
jgi:hypothetical protein